MDCEIRRGKFVRDLSRGLSRGTVVGEWALIAANDADAKSMMCLQGSSYRLGGGRPRPNLINPPGRRSLHALEGST